MDCRQGAVVKEGPLKIAQELLIILGMVGRRRRGGILQIFSQHLDHTGKGLPGQHIVEGQAANRLRAGETACGSQQQALLGQFLQQGLEAGHGYLPAPIIDPFQIMQAARHYIETAGIDVYGQQLHQGLGDRGQGLVFRDPRKSIVFFHPNKIPGAVRVYQPIKRQGPAWRETPGLHFPARPANIAMFHSLCRR